MSQPCLQIDGFGSMAACPLQVCLRDAVMVEGAAGAAAGAIHGDAGAPCSQGVVFEKYYDLAMRALSSSVRHVRLSFAKPWVQV